MNTHQEGPDPLSTLTAPPRYGSVVPDDDFERAIADAQAAVAEKRAAERELEAADDAQVAMVNRALAAKPANLSDNEVARQIGLPYSTFRSITSDLRKKRRRGAV